MRAQPLVGGALLGFWAGGGALGCTFQHWPQSAATSLLRVCNDNVEGLVVVVDGRRSLEVASQRCALERVAPGKHFLIARSARLGPERVRQASWVVHVPQGLVEVHFDNHQGLVDLAEIRGDSAPGEDRLRPPVVPRRSTPFDVDWYPQRP